MLIKTKRVSNKDALHKTNHIAFDYDNQIQNAAWSRMVSEDSLNFPCFCKGLTTHSTIDGIDGLKSLSQVLLLHMTLKKNVFQILSVEEKQNLALIGEKERPLLSKDKSSVWSTETLPHNL